MDNQLTYIIYCRKSTESKDRQVQSIESQRRELLELAKKQNLKVVKVLEESQSAYKLGRPVFKQMIGFINEGAANAILTWKADRLARNAIDGGRMIHILDQGLLKEIRTPSESYRQEDNRMLLYMLFGMSNDFSRQIGTNVRRGNRQKYERGEYCGKAPLGYLNADIGLHKNIIPDPAKAHIIKRIFEEFATGEYTVVDMAEKADSWGLKSINDKKIAKSGMYTILTRTAYYGLFKHGGEYHKGSYEPLIKKSLFDEVQLVLKKGSKPRKSSWKHAYKGVIKCGVCGCSITAETKVKYYKRTKRSAEYIYYRCTKRRGVCDQAGISEDDLVRMISSNIKKIEIDEDVWSLGVELFRDNSKHLFGQTEQIRTQLVKQLADVTKSLEVLLDMRIREEITAEEYQAHKKDKIMEKMSLTEKIKDADDGIEKWLERMEEYFETAFYARSVMNGDDIQAKKKLVQAVGWNLFLQDKKLHFEFNKPYDVLLKPNIRDDVQGCRDSNPE